MPKLTDLKPGFRILQTCHDCSEPMNHQSTLGQKIVRALRAFNANRRRGELIKATRVSIRAGVVRREKVKLFALLIVSVLAAGCGLEPEHTNHGILKEVKASRAKILDRFQAMATDTQAEADAQQAAIAEVLSEARLADARLIKGMHELREALRAALDKKPPSKPKPICHCRFCRRR